jgi:hypothetical protein
MERLYRVIFLVLFVVGFVGAVASQDGASNPDDMAKSPFASLFRDMRAAEEAETINAGRWNQDTQDLSSDGLAKIETIFAKAEDIKKR